MTFGAEYSDRAYAHFIAGGRTLDIIIKYEEDKKNAKETVEALRQELRATNIFFLNTFLFDHKIDDPRFVLNEKHSHLEESDFNYAITHATPEGRAFQARVDDIPFLPGDYKIFARRLTGTEEVHTNPDHLKDHRSIGSGIGYGDCATVAATYEKYGDIFVVSVPRVIHGIFNEVSRAQDKEYHFTGDVRMSDGYRYDWFTPPDSTPIPWSKVIELQEKELGDQTAPREVRGLKVILSQPPQP